MSGIRPHDGGTGEGPGLAEVFLTLGLLLLVAVALVGAIGWVPLRA